MRARCTYQENDDREHVGMPQNKDSPAIEPLDNHSYESVEEGYIPSIEECFIHPIHITKTVHKPMKGVSQYHNTLDGVQ
jgi:hypothetical protein